MEEVEPYIPIYLPGLAPCCGSGVVWQSCLAPACILYIFMFVSKLKNVSSKLNNILYDSWVYIFLYGFWVWDLWNKKELRAASSSAKEYTVWAKRQQQYQPHKCKSINWTKWRNLCAQYGMLQMLFPFIHRLCVSMCFSLSLSLSLSHPFSYLSAIFAIIFNSHTTQKFYTHL